MNIVNPIDYMLTKLPLDVKRNVEHILFNECGIGVLDRDLSEFALGGQTASISILNSIKEFNPELKESGYIFRKNSKRHYFWLSRRKLSDKMLLSTCPINNTYDGSSFKLNVTNDVIVLGFRWNLCPHSKNWEVMGQSELVFKGSRILLEHYKANLIRNTTHLYGLQPTVIKQYIDGGIAVLEADLKLYWNQDLPLKAISDVCSSTTQTLITLLTMVSVYTGDQIFKPNPVRKGLELEALEANLVQSRDDYKLIAELLLYLVGLFLDRNIATHYSYLLKGFKPE